MFLPCHSQYFPSFYTLVSFILVQEMTGLPNPLGFSNEMKKTEKFFSVILLICSLFVSMLAKNILRLKRDHGRFKGE